MPTNNAIAFKVVNARKVSFAPMACNIVIGYGSGDDFTGLFTVRDVILKKSPTKGYYYQAPAKPYMKNGEHVVDDNGYKKYLEYFTLYTEQTDDGYAPTKAAFAARKHLIDLMVKALEELGGEAPALTPRGNRGAAKPEKAPTAPDTIEDDEDEDGDDDLPF